VRVVEGGDCEQVAHPHHPFDLEDVLLFVQTEFGGQTAAAHRVHSRLDLQADNRRELALLQGRFDQRQQIVGVLLALFAIGIAGDPEQFTADHLHPREQHVEIVGHDLFEQHEVVPFANPHQTRSAGADRNLDPGQRELPVLRIAQGDQQVKGEVGDERKGVRRIDRLRCDQGEDVSGIVVPDLLALPGGKIGKIADGDPFLLQQILEVVEQALFPSLVLADGCVALLDLLLGGAAVDGPLQHPGAFLLLEAADPFHEEFVQIRTGDSGELDPLQQRRAFVEGLVQHALIEGQPGQLPIEIEFRRGEIGRGRGGFFGRLFHSFVFRIPWHRVIGLQGRPCTRGVFGRFLIV
jgi:hypothetical protein